MADRQGPEIPDGVELNKDGTVTLFTAGERCRLRRPKLGEFRKLRELLHERDDERLRLLGAQADDTPEKPGTEATNTEKLDYTLEVNRRSRQLNDAVTDLNIAWIATAMEMLAQGAVPAVDDWPSGMESTEFVAALADHWRAVPLRSGGA